MMKRLLGRNSRRKPVVRFRIQLGLVLGVLLVLFASPSDADVDGAVSWLLANQTGGSYWGGVKEVRLQNTATVIEVLRRLGESGSEVTSGEAWLANAVIRNNDDAARLLLALHDPPYDLSDELSNLLASQNAGSGWGLTGEYRSDPLDSGLGIRAMVAQGSGDGSSVLSAVSYLVGAQNGDGGWGNVPSGDSNVFVTSIVLLALEEQSAQGVSTEIGDGVAWLSAQANLDDGFGAGGNSSVVETALAYLAIIGHTPGSIVAADALIWLTAQQDGNGSWNDSPYETALGALALASSGPELYALDTEMSFNPPNPTEGQNVTITLPIHNGGLVTASSVTVSFYNGSPYLGDVNRDDSPYTIADVVYTISILLGTATPTQEQLDASDVNLDGYSATIADVVFMINVLLGSQTPLGGHIGDDVVASIISQGSSGASVIFGTTGHSGNNRIFAQIDPLDSIAESNETNNLASAQLFVISTVLASRSGRGVNPPQPVTGMEQLPQPLDLPGGNVVVEVRIRTQRPLGGAMMHFTVSDGVTFGEPSCGPTAGDLSLFSEAEGAGLCAVLASFEGHHAEPGEGVLLKIPLTVKYPRSQLTLTNISFSTDDGQLTTIDQFYLEVKQVDPSWREDEREIESEASGEGRENR